MGLVQKAVRGGPRAKGCAHVTYLSGDIVGKRRNGWSLRPIKKRPEQHEAIGRTGGESDISTFTGLGCCDCGPHFTALRWPNLIHKDCQAVTLFRITMHPK